MDANDLDSTDVRHYCASVNGQIVPGWQRAVGWDRQETPIRWRMLNADKPEDQRLRSDLVITWQAPTRAA
jgi:hypothetical protein